MPGQPAIFLLFGDGNQFLTDFHAATVLDNLTASKDLPPTVALFVDPPSDGDRVRLCGMSRLVRLAFLRASPPQSARAHEGGRGRGKERC